MDFFSSAQNTTNEGEPSLDPFAQAIANRFGSSSIVTARLLPSPSIRDHPQSTPSASSVRASTAPTASSSTHAGPFTAVAPDALAAVLAAPGVLVLDIRSHAAHAAARLPHALSLCVPSTLLKRPLFSLEKLSAMLPSPAARAAFAAWPAARAIVVYDADAAAVPEGSNIRGLLNKFKKEGFAGELAWLVGGFQAVWRTQRALVDAAPPPPEPEQDAAPTGAELTTRHVPMAFSHASTTQANAAAPPPMALPGRVALPARPAANPFFDAIRQNTELSQGITERIPLRLPRRVRRRIGELPFPWLRDIARRAAVTAVDSSDTSEEEPDADEDPRFHGAPATPHHHRAHHAKPPTPQSADVEEGTEALAMQFYRIELAEQRRLLGVMEYHSKESGPARAGPSSDEPHGRARAEKEEFPFSITAGVEKGAKNRYRHIWPFEHARVRLHRRRSGESSDDDYVNASYVQPLGTSRRYIATQGPLPATFNDFWTLCWEQNVHVIVMLTREIEGAMVKCGNYWTDSTTAFGPLVLTLVSTTTNAPAPAAAPFNLTLPAAKNSAPAPSAGGFFDPPPAHANTAQEGGGAAPPSGSTITRVFELRNTRFPGAGARRVTHLQYLDWPDMNVPDDARGVLALVRAVDDAVKASGAGGGEGEEGVGVGGVDADGDVRMGVEGAVDARTGVAVHALGGKSPVLLHCSAGVGRTGGFIAVDALLDAVRREMRKKLQGRGEASPGGDAFASGSSIGVGAGMGMDVDGVPTRTAPLQVATGKGGSARDAGQTVHVPVAPAHEHSGGPKHTQNRNRDRASNSNDAGLATDVSNAASSESGNGDEASPSAWGHAGGSGTTRRWAEAVSDSTGVTGGGLKYPNMHGSASASHARGTPSESASSASSSSLGMTTGSSGMEAGGTTSSVGTSMSGPSRSSREKGREKGKAGVAAEAQASESSGSAQGQTNNSSGTSSTAGAPRPTVSTSSTNTAGSKAANTSTVPAGRPTPPAGPTRQDTARPAALSSDSSVEVGLSSSEWSAPASVPVRSVSPPHSQASLPPSSSGPASSRHPTRGFVTARSHLQETVSSSEADAEADDAMSEHGPVAAIVDYKEPRALHADASPPPISSYEEPVWQIVQDMREQRMSLCQSLRQYVFVHAALIEGALMVADEERARARGEAEAPAAQLFAADMVDTPMEEPAPAPAKAKTQAKPPMHLAMSPSKSKRGASPTELLRKDMKGEVSLAKKPSIKRKHSSPLERDPAFGDGKGKAATY
ncbi:hypothetical protein HWV62_17678 [Athelia sp. TMB]|nr:hypothetical protein HWV62_17678 [Athelia sp. TMB]